MNPHKPLNLPKTPLRLRKQQEQEQVWDPIRKIWLVLTPEEWVRQHLIGLLTLHLGVPPTLIAQEYPIKLGGANQRADIVVLGKNGAPCLLVECKAPSIKLDEQVLDQAVRYNSVVEAPLLLISNGISHLCWEVTPEGKYRPTHTLPDLSSYLTGVDQL